ncbi:MAG: twin-arginine translocation signal domain-containing protein [Candidatus Pacearchaeota archaeon]
MQTRRDFLKNAGKAVGLMALAGGCYTLGNSNNPRAYFGERWNEISYKERSKIREEWIKYDDKLRGLISDTYQNPEKAYNSLSDDGKESVDNFYRELKINPNFKKQDDYLEVKELSDHFPWINLENPKKEDVVFLRKIGEIIVSVIMFHQ